MDIEAKTTKSYTNLGSNVSSIQHLGTSGGANFYWESYSGTLNQPMIWMILVHWENCILEIWYQWELTRL